jgi:hypothetical protein
VVSNFEASILGLITLVSGASFIRVHVPTKDIDIDLAATTTGLTKIKQQCIHKLKVPIFLASFLLS